MLEGRLRTRYNHVHGMLDCVLVLVIDKFLDCVAVGFPCCVGSVNRPFADSALDQHARHDKGRHAANSMHCAKFVTAHQQRQQQGGAA